MASAKIVLRAKKDKQGLSPLTIRVIKDRKVTFVYTGQYIKLSDWDESSKSVKKSHPNSGRLNNLLLKKLAEINNKVLEIESSDKPVSSHVIKQQVKGKSKSTTFFAVAEEHLQALEYAKKYSQYNTERSRIKRLEEFFGTQKVFFEEIDEKTISNLRTFLKIEHELSERTITNYLILIRTLYNKAIRASKTDGKSYPFGKGKLVIKFPESNKIGLTEKEVQALEQLPFDKRNARYHAKNVWLFAFYFAGIRISDVLLMKWSDIVDGRLLYTMSKNKKVLSLTIPKKALAILKQYEDIKTEPTDFIFPELKGCKVEHKKYINTRINTSVRKLNRRLTALCKEIGIKKNISMHIARHTFGNISGDKIPVQMLQKLYRHSSITTTINYQSNFIHKDTDKALESVIDF